MNLHISWHHDKTVSMSRPLELTMEFFTNMSWFFYLLLFQWICNVQYLSNTLILFIGLWYSSIHLLNLTIFKSNEHIIHHMERKYNYGPPYMDLLFGTLKQSDDEPNKYEFVNGIVIFCILYFMTKTTD